MIPKSIGIIMDGNRRWAKSHNLPTFEGHRLGYSKLKDVMVWAKNKGIEYVTVFAFSTENWNRMPEEVYYLLDLFKFVLTDEIEVLIKDNIRIRCVGEVERFSEDLRVLITKAEEKTKNLSGPTLVLALSYGGRAEILDSAKRAIATGDLDISEDKFTDLLWTKGISDPDLIIRTGGEMRLSGFLPWQSVYSELFFSKTLWPDFSEEEFVKILAEFSERERRMGK